MSASKTVYSDIFFLIVSLSFLQFDGAAEVRTAYKNHKSQLLTDQQIVKISELSNVSHFDFVLDKILIPRVVATPNHAKVRNYIRTALEELGWDVEVDSFSDNTPRFGEIDFHNVIATWNPNAQRFLALACHYDSKYFREGSFLGATDSAVPCAMMINLAYTMKNELNAIQNKTDISLKLIFFDGEEALVEWGPKDSIYGARHLAAKWSNIPDETAGTSYLDRLDLIVLLDLLGARDPQFFNFFPQTEEWYRQMVDAEEKLASLGKRTQYSVTRPRQRYFQPRSTHGAVEDDHIPFLRRNVPILHVIPLPFPGVWHTQGDNRRAVDIPTVENLNKILRVFTAGYLRMQV